MDINRTCLIISPKLMNNNLKISRTKVSSSLVKFKKAPIRTLKIKEAFLKPIYNKSLCIISKAIK